jgi:hypothetical protein
VAFARLEPPGALRPEPLPEHVDQRREALAGPVVRERRSRLAARASGSTATRVEPHGLEAEAGAPASPVPREPEIEQAADMVASRVGGRGRARGRRTQPSTR